MRAALPQHPYHLAGRLIFDDGQRKGIPKYAEHLVRQVYSVVRGVGDAGTRVGDAGTCPRVVDCD